MSRDDDSVQELLDKIRDADRAGVPRTRIRARLLDAGVEREDADALINAALADAPRRRRAYSSSSSEGGASSWLVWIGILVGLNVLSYVFDWGWYFW